jgi:CRISPR-associated protein Csy3
MLERFTAAYLKQDGFNTLGGLYAWNIANARYLWRNRYGLNKTVTVQFDGEEATLEFKADTISLEDPKNFLASADGQTLAQRLAAALAGESKPLNLRITASVRLSPCQEVWPSQEFIQSEGRSKRPGDKGKTLASVPLVNDRHQAVLHSQKIGNALRTIDLWHDHVSDYGPIAVEPYGVVQKYAETARKTSTDDLFTLLQKIDVLAGQAEKGTVARESHFLAACLVRGGVYSGESKDDQKAKKAAKE